MERRNNLRPSGILTGPRDGNTICYGHTCKIRFIIPLPTKEYNFCRKISKKRSFGVEIYKKAERTKRQVKCTCVQIT